jgi:glycine cleavage system transcriptional repressor
VSAASTSAAGYAVTVIGRDRPGIIAETTARLAELGLNLEDSTMTLLRGHFAMMLICAGEAGARDIEDALAPLTIDRSLKVSVAEVPAEPSPPTGGSPWVLTVHGGDRAGIVSAVVAEVARDRPLRRPAVPRPGRGGRRHPRAADLSLMVHPSH